MPEHDDIEIRHAVAKDQEAIAELYLDARVTDSKDPVTALHQAQTLLQRYLDRDDSRLWVVEIGDSGPVGMIGLWPTNAHTVELKHLRVSEEYRSRGLGRVLVGQAVEECRKRDMLKVVLDTYVERKPAVSLFEKLGFQLAGTREVNGKQVFDFYMNLYNDETEPGH